MFLLTVWLLLQAFGTNKAGVVSRGFFETAKPALKKTTSDGGAAPMAEDSAAAPAQDLNDKGEVVTSAAVRVLFVARVMPCRRLTQCLVAA